MRGTILWWFCLFLSDPWRRCWKSDVKEGLTYWRNGITPCTPSYFAYTSHLRKKAMGSQRSNHPLQTHNQTDCSWLRVTWRERIVHSLPAGSVFHLWVFKPQFLSLQLHFGDQISASQLVLEKEPMKNCSVFKPRKSLKITPWLFSLARDLSREGPTLSGWRSVKSFVALLPGEGIL